MADSLGIENAAMAGAIALAMAFVMGLAPVAARLIGARLRAEIARDVQTCRDSSAESLVPAPPAHHLVRITHWLLSGLWLLASVIMWRHLGVSAWPYAGLLVALLVLSLTDLDVQLLPGELVGAVLWSGILAALFQAVDLRLVDAVLGVVFGWALFSIPNWLLSATRRTDDPAMGQGDIGLLAACGAWLGPQGAMVAAGIALVLALLVRLALTRFVRDVPLRLPFGPLIAAGTVIVLCFPLPPSLVL